MRAAILFCFSAFALVVGWLFWGQNAQKVATWFSPSVALGIEATGQWGDSFGAFNAFVSAIGSAAVLTTLWLQGRSLKDQARDLHRQRFESTFFELMRTLREIREGMRFRHSPEYVNAKTDIGNIEYREGPFGTVHVIESDFEEAAGYQAISRSITELRFWSLKSKDKDTSVGKLYNSFIHKNNELTFSPYFRIIYTILQRIRDDGVLKNEEKASYGNLLRGQLTSDEVILLGANGMTAVAKDLDKLLIEFRMLKYLPKTDIRIKLQSHYGDVAFEGRPDNVQGGSMRRFFKFMGWFGSIG